MDASFISFKDGIIEHVAVFPEDTSKKKTLALLKNQSTIQEIDEKPTSWSISSQMIEDYRPKPTHANPYLQFREDDETHRKAPTISFTY